MYDDDRDWDNENELAQERATDPDYIRMHAYDNLDAWDTPEQRAKKIAEANQMLERMGIPA